MSPDASVSVDTVTNSIANLSLAPGNKTATVAAAAVPAITDPALNQPIAPDKLPAISAPFADFAGRCFMRGALCIDVLMAWIQANQPPARAEMEVAADRYDWHVSGWLRTSIGAAACAVAAAALVAIFWASSLRSLVPLFFLLVISFVALRFGQFAGVVGTICAALLFASVLFEPRPSLAMSNPAERNHLISMIVIGICAAEFLGRRKRAEVYKPWLDV
jgi:uncharacterized protein DUF4118